MQSYRLDYPPEIVIVFHDDGYVYRWYAYRFYNLWGYKLA